MSETVLDATGVELVPTEHAQTLFRTDDPVEVLRAAAVVADALKGALRAGGMVQRIGANEHVRIDGWQTLGAMLGVSAYVVWSRPLADFDGYEARAEARTADGRIVGAAEAMVTRAERNWTDAEDYALRSMAQTRAMSKALRGPLGFVITLAGHDATPAEEAVEREPEPATLPAWAQPASDEAVLQTADMLVGILGAADVQGSLAIATQGIGREIREAGGGAIPWVVARAVAAIHAVIDPPPHDPPGMAQEEATQT